MRQQMSKSLLDLPFHILHPSLWNQFKVCSTIIPLRSTGPLLQVLNYVHSIAPSTIMGSKMNVEGVLLFEQPFVRVRPLLWLFRP